MSFSRFPRSLLPSKSTHKTKGPDQSTGGRGDPLSGGRIGAERVYSRRRREAGQPVNQVRQGRRLTMGTRSMADAGAVDERERKAWEGVEWEVRIAAQAGFRGLALRVIGAMRTRGYKGADELLEEVQTISSRGEKSDTGLRAAILAGDALMEKGRVPEGFSKQVAIRVFDLAMRESHPLVAMAVLDRLGPLEIIARGREAFFMDGSFGLLARPDLVIPWAERLVGLGIPGAEELLERAHARKAQGSFPAISKIDPSILLTEWVQGCGVPPWQVSMALEASCGAQVGEVDVNRFIDKALALAGEMIRSASGEDTCPLA